MGKINVVENIDEAAEKALLGCILLDDNIINEVIQTVKPEAFARRVNRRIFEAMIGLASDGEGIDAVTLKNKLVSGGRDSTDLLSYLLSLMETPTSSVMWRSYARILNNKYILRRLARACVKTIEDVNAWDGEKEPSEILSVALNRLIEIDDSHCTESIDAGTLLQERLVNIRNPEKFLTVPGFEDIHLFGGDLFVIGGRPGAGKTAFALQLAVRWAFDNAVMFYSYEMTEQQLADRIMSMVSGIPVHVIESGLNEEQEETIRRGMEQVNGIKLSIRRAAGMSNAELFSDMYRFRASGGQIVIIDYLQLAADKIGKNMTADITLFSNALRRVALDTGLLVVALAQLNRNAADRDGVRLPVISDLRESGAIEQDANVIALMTALPNPKTNEASQAVISHIITPNMYFKMSDLDAGTGDPLDDPVFVLVDFAKVRQGRRKRWPFIFHGDRMLFKPVKEVEYVDYNELMRRFGGNSEEKVEQPSLV